MTNDALNSYTAWHRLKSRLIFIYDDAVPACGSGTNLRLLKYSAWLIKKGHLDIQYANCPKKRIGMGFWVIPPIRVRDQLFSTDAEILSIRFELEWYNGLPIFPIDHVLYFSATAYPEMEATARELLKTSSNHLALPPVRGKHGSPDFNNICGIQEKYWKWLSAFHTAMNGMGVKPLPPPNHDQRVIDIMRFLDSSVFSGPIPYEYLQQKVSLSKVHINRLFLEQTGMSIKKYLEMRILEECKELLATSLFPTKEIAIKLGFKTSSHFCSWFKRKTGIYPSAYEQEAKMTI